MSNPATAAPGTGIVDSQLHVWNPETPETPWHRGWAPYATHPSFGIGDAIAAMNEAGVERAVLVPATWDINGTELALEAAATYPRRFGVFGTLSLRRVDPRALEALAGRPGMLGLRQAFPPGSSRSYLDDGTADWFWPAAERAGVDVMVWMPDQLSHLRPILDANPDLRVIVDHLNLTMGPPFDSVRRSVTELCALADRPNLAVKASALPASAPDQFPYLSMQGVLREVVDAFGAGRVFWGSDMTRLPCTYRQTVSMITTSTLFSAQEKTLIMGRAICNWLDWNPNEAVSTTVTAESEDVR